MQRRIFPEEKGRVFSYILVALLISMANSIVQVVIFNLYIMDLLPVGWGGLVAPVAVVYLSLIITLPSALIFLLFWPKPYFSVFGDWQFLVLCLLPFAGITCLIIYLIFPLDGGGSLFSRFISGL